MDPETIPIPTIQGEEWKAQQAAFAAAAHTEVERVLAELQRAHDALEENPAGKGIRGELMSLVNRLTHSKSLI